MPIDFTDKETRASVFGILFALFIGIFLLALSGCSGGYEQNSIKNEQAYTGAKSFSFKENGSDWRVDFENDEISNLYKNGTRVPDDEIDQYSDMIYENLRGLRKKYEKLDKKMESFNFDSGQLDQEMKKFKEDFDSDKFLHFKLEFDEDEFEKNMEQLEQKLQDLKDKKLNLYFDSEEFKNQMKDLEENLKDIPFEPNPPVFDIDVYMDMDALKNGMNKLGDSFKHFDFKFDSSEFNMNGMKESMKELKKNLKGLKIELRDLKGEMKKLDSFLEDLKSELVKDGYLNSVDEEYDLEFGPESTKINDTLAKNEDHKKYLELYKRHFDKEIDGTIKINKD